MEGEKDKTKVLTKLHKYFGHVSPEALYRILKASTVREKFTEAEIREINDACYTCNTNKKPAHWSPAHDSAVRPARGGLAGRAMCGELTKGKGCRGAARCPKH